MTHVAGTGIDYSTWMLQEPSPWAARQPSRSDPESKIGSRVHDSDPDQSLRFTIWFLTKNGPIFRQKGGMLSIRQTHRRRGLRLLPKEGFIPLAINHSFRILGRCVLHGNKDPLGGLLDFSNLKGSVEQGLSIYIDIVQYGEHSPPPR